MTAVLVKVVKNTSSADVLANIRANVKPEEMGTEIKFIRQTHQGEVLFTISNTTKKEVKAPFSEAVRGVM